MRMWVPPRVSRELIEERRQYGADLDLVCSTDDITRQWTRELRRLDPLLKLVRAPETGINGLPLYPGAYHVIRMNQGAPWTVTPIVTNDGEYMEPPGSLLEQMKGMDLQDVHVRMDRERRIADAQAAEEKEKETARARRLEAGMDSYRARFQTSVSMNRDQPWTQGVRGKRAASQRPKKGDG